MSLQMRLYQLSVGAVHDLATSTGNDTRPSSELPGKALPDNTATATIETITDDTE